MKVKLARTAGFCMGVKRAMDMVLSEALRGNGPIYTYGPLIHNRQVLQLLEQKGIYLIDDVSELKEGVLLIRAHGIPPQIREKLRSLPLKVIDATCPRVAKVQAIIRYYSRKGYKTVIFGEREHPEVIGLLGYAENGAHVINSLSDIMSLPSKGPYLLVAQTTQELGLFDEISKAFQERFPDSLIINTICDTTVERQKEVKRICSEVDAMVVVGGYHSGNTKRLAEVARSTGIPTFHIERADELPIDKLSHMKIVGLTGGASTPNWIIKEVLQRLERISSYRELGIWKGMKMVMSFFSKTNMMIFLGALSLSYAIKRFWNMPIDGRMCLLVSLYLYGLHLINRFLDKGSGTYNEPDTARFYNRYRKAFVLISSLCILFSLILAYNIEKMAFLILICLTMIGLAYSLFIIPSFLPILGRYRSIKDIPGSKTLSIPIAWTTMIGILPFLEYGKITLSPILLTCSIVFSLIFIRTSLFDIFHIQGDLIVGTETIPVIIGEKNSLKIIEYLSALMILPLFYVYISGVVRSPEILFFILCFPYALLLVNIYRKGWIYPGLRLETMVDGILILPGILSMIWNILLK